MKNVKRGNRRRGILLLIVLSILVMFGLMLITFVIITGQAKRAAKGNLRIEQYFDPADRQTHEAAMVLLRGSNDPGCPVALRNLLEDMYGDDTLANIFLGSPPLRPLATPTVDRVCGGQLMNVAATYVTPPNTSYPPPYSFYPLATPALMLFPEKRVGCVLTMLNGPAAWRSTRIVGYFPDGTKATPPRPYPLFQLAAFDDVATATLETFCTQTSPINYIINGAAFSGTGIGYNLGYNPATEKYDLPPTGKLDEKDSQGHELALTLRPFLTPQEYQPWAAGPDGIPGTSDDRKFLANKEYTAVDHQTPSLALKLPDGRVPIPSFHRSELVQYWATRVPSFLIDPNDARLRVQVVLRPMPQDHFVDVNGNGQWDPGEPAFTGSNPNFNPTWDGTSAGGAWDVDTDGDGIPDAVWVDFGFPVRSLPDGRLVKPLVAVQVVDLDGRLNVNAHGTYAQTVPQYYSPITNAFNSTSDPYFCPWPTGFVFPPGMSPPSFVFSPGSSPITLPRGFGYGPAEINLLPLFGDYFMSNLATRAQMLKGYSRLLYRDFTDAVTPPIGRYFPSAVPGSNNPLDDPLHLNKWYDYGGGYWTFTPAGTMSYGSPPNRLGDGAIGLDPGGRPLYARMGRIDLPGTGNPVPPLGDDERLNDPYKLNLSKATPVNTPYAPVELERLMRFYDLDAARLPSRLVDLGLAGRGSEITTASWHVPAPTFFIPKHLLAAGDITQGYVPRAGAPKPGILDDLADPKLPAGVRGWLLGLIPGRSASDLLSAKFYVELRRLPPRPAPPPNQFAPVPAMQAAQRMLANWGPQLLPLELLSRLKMDVNRPFGNARDDDGNGVVDDPAEAVRLQLAGGQEQFPQVNAANVTGLTTFFHENAGGPSNGLRARQLYARHLYVMMMMMIDTNNLMPGLTDAEKARLVAQWAVNVVDFRDRDSIMTPFEYDIHPFLDDNNPTTPTTPWNVDGDITTDDGDPSFQWHGIVWGCERPELLITETLAVHDRRVENLKIAGKQWYWLKIGDKPPNDWYPNFRQRKKPSASLFLELYNPWTPLEPQPAESNGPDSGGVVGVQLNRVAWDVADKSRTTSGKPEKYASPVWRMVIVRPSNPEPDPDREDGKSTPNVERSIYLVDLDPANDPTNLNKLLATERPDAASVERFYWKQASGEPGMSPIYPGCYAAIGPRRTSDTETNAFTTYIGRRRTGFPPTNPDKEPTDSNRTRQIRLKSRSGGTWQDTAGSPILNNITLQPSPAWIRQPVTIGISEPRPLNISDPLGGYRVCDDTVNDVYSTPFDPPDYTRTDWMKAYVNLYGTSLNVETVHLQRLADPTRGYNRYTNPYRTIDSMPIDLTAFNGWDEPDVIPSDSQGIGATEDPAKPVKFGTRQRGSKYDTRGAYQAMENRLWPQMSIEPDNSTPSTSTPEHYFGKWDWDPDAHTWTQRGQYALRHSLGYLNNLDNNSTNNLPPNLRYQNNNPGWPNTGDPKDVAFPWLNWNNRPFVSELELLQVPVAKSSLLLRPYNPPGSLFGYGFAAGGDPYAGTGQHFPHLLNFFGSGAAAPGVYRLLDLVGVPSPFVGTEIQGNPAVFAASAGHTFYPPFNRIPNYREPGRMNVNTVSSPSVYAGLMNYFPGLSSTMDQPPPAKPGNFWRDQFLLSRRGYGTASVGANWPDVLLQMNTAAPTRFANPFRSYGGQLFTTLLPPQLNTAEVNATLLRADPSGSRPLFGFDGTVVSPYVPAPEQRVRLGDFNNPDRNPFFRYQGLDRLGNLVTTRSNVFAAWITVGTFEVQSAPPRVHSDGSPWLPLEYQAVYPDRYALGREVGADTGDIKRHRAFYIFDRSIPVGFQRGQDLNAEKTIVLKRYIE